MRPDPVRHRPGGGRSRSSRHHRRPGSNLRDSIAPRAGSRQARRPPMVSPPEPPSGRQVARRRSGQVLREAMAMTPLAPRGAAWLAASVPEVPLSPHPCASGPPAAPAPPACRVARPAPWAVPVAVARGSREAPEPATRCRGAPRRVPPRQGTLRAPAWVTLRSRSGSEHRVRDENVPSAAPASTRRTLPARFPRVPPVAAPPAARRALARRRSPVAVLAARRGPLPEQPRTRSAHPDAAPPRAPRIPSRTTRDGRVHGASAALEEPSPDRPPRPAVALERPPPGHRREARAGGVPA